MRVDRRAERIYLSKIFDWFDDDFLDDEREAGNDDPILVDYVNRFRGDAAPRCRADYRCRFFPFDKGLNRR